MSITIPKCLIPEKYICYYHHYRDNTAIFSHSKMYKRSTQRLRSSQELQALQLASTALKLKLVGGPSQGVELLGFTMEKWWDFNGSEWNLMGFNGS